MVYLVVFVAAGDGQVGDQFGNAFFGRVYFKQFNQRTGRAGFEHRLDLSLQAAFIDIKLPVQRVDVCMLWQIAGRLRLRCKDGSEIRRLQQFFQRHTHIRQAFKLKHDVIW